MTEVSSRPISAHPASLTFDGFALGSWARRYAERFKIEALLHARGIISDTDGNDAFTESDGSPCKCPFAPDDLSHCCTCKDIDLDDIDFDVELNRSRKDGEKRDLKNQRYREFFRCTHPGCQHHSPLQFIKQSLHNGWITLDDLQDPAFGGGPLLPDGFTVGDEHGDGSEICFTKVIHDASLVRQVAAERALPRNLRSYGLIKTLEKRIKDEAQVIFTRLCDYIRVDAITQNEHGERLGRRLAYFAPNGDLQYYDIADMLLDGNGSALVAELSKIGLTFDSNPKLWPAVVRMLKDSEAPRRVVLYSRPGWHQSNRLFVTPSGLVLTADRFDTPGVKHALASDVFPNQGIFADDAHRAAWQSVVVAQIWQGDTDQFAFAHLLGCAGVLSSLIDENFGFHFWGHTSIGKTTAQIIAAACVADPAAKKGNLVTADLNAHQVDAVRQRATGTCLHIDDLKTGKINLETLAYLGGSGSWKSLYSVSSELGLRQLVRDMQDGMVVRLPSLNFAKIAPIDPSRADAIKRAARTHFGTVLPPFVRQVMAFGWHDTTSLLRDDVDRIANELAADTPPQRRAQWLRAAKPFAILRKAGEVLLAAKELPDGVGIGDIDRVVQWGWDTYLLGATDQDPLEASLSALSNWLTQSGRLQPLRGPSRGNTVGPWIDGDVVHLPSAMLRKIPGLAIAPAALIKALKERKQLLVPGTSGKNLTWSDLPGRRRMRHYRIRGLIAAVNSAP